ncbi:MAG: DUF1697 domain-containing protein, partial [Spirochaetia bacterium]
MAGSQVALLRGVNVGRANRVSMEALRELVSNLGYGDVRTLLNSGNVVFTIPRGAPRDAASRIEKALVAEVGISASVTVLSSAEIARVIEENPLLKYADNPSRLFVALLKVSADRAKLLPLSKQDWGKDALGVGTRAAYLWCAEGLTASKLNEAVNRLLRDGVTSRNWATIL